MQVILKENISNLGRIGDIVKVSDGYARNYLLPRNLVVQADPKNVTQLEHHKKILEKKRQAQKADAEEIAKKLTSYSCTITKKVGENDKLFGSVTTSEISNSLKKGGFEIPKSTIILDSPIKALGVHTVTVKLENDVTANLKIWVVKEE